MKIRVHKDKFPDLLKEAATIISVGRNQYYYFPYTYRYEGDYVYIYHVPGITTKDYDSKLYQWLKDHDTKEEKKCKSCGEQGYIWAYGRCKVCDARFKQESRSEGAKIGDRTMYSFDKYKKRKEIKAVSDKRAKELKEYRKLRDEYLKIHTTCEARVESVCSGGPVELHHLKPRAYHLCDTDVFCAVCRRCHEWIERNDAEARKLNLKLDHL